MPNLNPERGRGERKIDRWMDGWRARVNDGEIERQMERERVNDREGRGLDRWAKGEREQEGSTK